MSKQRTLFESSNLLILLCSVLLALGGLVYFASYYKILTLAAGAWCIYLLLRRGLNPVCNLPTLLFLAYVSICGLTRLWAISGKFFLVEFSEIFVAVTLFLTVMLKQDFSRDTVRSIMKLLASVSGIYSVLSVEAATTGISEKLLCAVLPTYNDVNISFETGTRLTGIVGNANVLSSILALGILCGIYLLCSTDKRINQLFYTGLTALNAFVFLLLFSMGGTACFVLSVFVYLIFAGKDRSGALVRMLECAVPTVIWVFVAFPFFSQSGSIIPLCAMAGNIITAVLLESLIGSRMSRLLAGYEKLTMAVFAGVITAACAFIVLGISLTEAYTFSGDVLRRSAYPAAGEHTLSIEASASVNVTIVSQDMSQIMMHDETILYRGSAENAVFTVPEDSKVCYFTFSAGNGTVLETAVLDSGENLKLKYTLLPGFIANRIQGLFANQNAIQRTVFFRDGMKMFYNSPIVGNGVGSFETGITSVQEFSYATKYIHNHYIQVLLEAGILGFLPLAGALLCMVFLLLKRRRDTEWEFSAEYPVLWACLVMVLAHITVEISMSIIVFIWMAYMIFALVLRCCDPAPLQLPALKGAAGRIVFLTLPVVFVLSLCCNVAVGRIAKSPVRSIDEYFENMELAASLDPYEANDAKLSYVLQAFNNQQDERMPQANEYAAQLLTYQSNTIPSVLLDYYLYTYQYEESFRAAQAAAVYSASNSDVWNQSITSLGGHFMNSYSSPLLSERHNGVLMEHLLNYYRTLQTRNAESMEAITLNTSSKDFFSRVLMLAQTDLSNDAVYLILSDALFDSSACCDANQDLIPDQAAAHQGVTFGESWSFDPHGSVTLEVLSRNNPAPVSIAIECESPEAISVTDSAGAVLPGSISGNVWTGGEIVQEELGVPLKVTIRSDVPQQITHLTIFSE